MEREVFDDLWDKADREYRSQGNNSFTFRHHLFAVLDDELKVQPKLSIPRKIAEELDQEIVADDITKFAMFHEGFERLWLSDDLTKYCMDYKNYALASVYLAGKALGVELVEVEG